MCRELLRPIDYEAVTNSLTEKKCAFITTQPLYKRPRRLLATPHRPTQPHADAAMKLYLLTAAGAGAAAVVVAIVAATAAADAYASSSSSSSAGVFSSPCFLWAAANVIVLWLVSSYRGHTAAAAGDGVAEGGGGGDGVDMGLYTLSLGRRDDVLFAVPDVVADLVDAVAAAPVVVTTTAAVAAAKKKKKQPREERAAKRGTNHPRVRKASAGGEAPVRAVAAEATARPDSPRVRKASAGVVETPRSTVAAEAKPDQVVVKKPALVEEEWLTWNLASTAEATAKPDMRKSVVEVEWPDWSSFVEEATPADAKKPLVDEDEWSAWALALACTTEAKPAVVEKPVVVQDPWPSRWTIAAPEVKKAIKKPVAVEDPWPSSRTIAAPVSKPRGVVKEPGEEWAITVATTTEPNTKPDADGGAADDVSMESMWQTILQSGRARPVTVRKSETWATGEQPQRERAAEASVARRREIRKSATATNMTPPPSPPHVRAPPPPARQPWRTRDVLPAMQNDELMRRAESLIRRHHEQLRLQRQESEQRQALELQRRRPLIRV
ncbi:uncharacterized protein LOC107305073 [Oryza brachyantha]|uniref:uncharacterized protein LOC107305073 n=1 Tax=Oryza brachyantha TaxID=4533 RepID=UPI001ADBD715|nr:uncharacterized protein LOC107305073 [Oryza brachyantha]